MHKHPVASIRNTMVRQQLSGGTDVGVPLDIVWKGNSQISAAAALRIAFYWSPAIGPRTIEVHTGDSGQTKLPHLIKR
jgi:hypothetical protein